MIEIPHARRYIIERCPYCKRRLAEWFEGDDHVTILHTKAAIRMSFEVPLHDGQLQEGHYGAGPVEGTAKCYRLLCRLRRRINS